jgi:hypothetical protein
MKKARTFKVGGRLLNGHRFEFVTTARNVSYYLHGLQAGGMIIDRVIRHRFLG